MNNLHLYAIRLMALALLAIATVMGISPNASAARSEPIEISFDLAPVTPSAPAEAVPVPKPAPETQSNVSQTAPQTKPLAMPTQATRIPVGMADRSGITAELPPPPPEAYMTERSPEPAQSESAQSESAQSEPIRPEFTQSEPIQFEPEQPEPEPLESAPSEPAPSEPAPTVTSATTSEPKPTASSAESTADSTADSTALESGALSFDLDRPTASSAAPTAQAASSSSVQAASPSDSEPNQTQQPASQSIQPMTAQEFGADLEALFQNGSNSIVAKAVGSAEGTRTPDGGRTWAYRGHVDPGNGVWNLGTFSYQHGANSPNEADQKQLERLKRQAETLRQGALQRGLALTLEEELNGIDLANQSPRAALSRGGYMDRLKEAHDIGLSGSDAVLWARTRSFLDPDTNRWNAPGLGNTTHGVTSDQDRRMRAIARAIEAQQQIAQPPSAAADQQAMLQPSAPVTPPEPKREEVANQPPDAEQMEAIANDIISLDLSPM